MNVSPYKIIAIDLDGTLLDRDGRIPERNRQAVRAALQRGLHVVICTGRGVSSTRQFVEELGMTDTMPVVLRNGAVVKERVQGPISRRSMLDADHARELARHLQAADLHPILCVDDAHMEDFYISYRAVAIERERTFYAQFDARMVPVHDVTHPDYGHVTVVGARGEGPALRELKARLDAAPPVPHHSHVITLGGDEFYFEGFRHGTNKWDGLLHIAAQLGIDPGAVWAIGDAINDLAMIRNAGYGIAMQNGSAECRAVAKEIAPLHSECGVAQMIEKHFLG